MPDRNDPHRGQPVLHAGIPVGDARLVAILLHGRGSSATDILGLSRELNAADIACLAPQASGYVWYPHSFLAPLDWNEPSLSSALGLIARLIDDLEGQGILSDRIVLMGFSQGAPWSSRHATHGDMPRSRR